MNLNYFHDLFTDLEQQLWRYRPYWQFQPMQQAALPEPFEFLPPEFANELQQLDFAECAQLDADDNALKERFSKYFAHWQCPQLPRTLAEPVAAPFWLSTGISGRKWQQICQFAGAIGQKELPVLEWCAGKGHLGRVFAGQFGNEVHSLEWQASLCAEGQQLAGKFQFRQFFHHVDVLKQPTASYFKPQQQWVALHACGDLHRVGLQNAVAAGTQDIALVPCCYHLQSADSYLHRSATARLSRLQLNKQDLRLAVQGHATGGARIERLSQQEMLWRHAFWAYAQSLGQPDYRPLRSVAKQIFSDDIAGFFTFACQQQALAVPSTAAMESALVVAEQRLLNQRRLELCQHVFRRPLELYLVTDLALLLAEQGYQVELQELCASNLTPRNLLLSAKR